MQKTIQERTEFIRRLGESRFAKTILLLWGCLATYDLFLAQLIPESIGKAMPRAWQVAVATGDLLTWQQWMLVLVLTVAIIALEFSFRNARDQPPIGIAEVHYAPPNGRVSLREATAQAYSQERERKSVLAAVAERGIGKQTASPDEVLQYMAVHMCFTRMVPLAGRRLPALQAENIPHSEIQRYHFNGPDVLVDHAGATVYSDLSVAVADLNRYLLGLSDEFGASLTEADDFETGFQRASYQRDPSRTNAILYFAQLRSAGVRMRNEAQAGHVNEQTVDDWVARVARWTQTAIEVLDHVDRIDSEVFKTLDIVKIARIQAPIRLQDERDIRQFLSTYNQLDMRLDEMKRLLLKYQDHGR